MRPSTVIGVFKGMGDLICAVPVMRAELEQGKSVHILLFPSDVLREFCSLIDFSPYQEQVHLHMLPTYSRAASWKQFLGEMRALQPEMVWISPHAPAKDSSWKIPLALRIIQTLFWSDARLVGAESERMSLLFHQRLPADRTLPLRQREWNAYCLLRGPVVGDRGPATSFVPEIAGRRDAPALYDLAIHPGANASNRRWPLDKYAPLLSHLPDSWRIALVGLPADLKEIRKTIPTSRPVEYVSGTILASIKALAYARLLFIMDSGNMHFAQVLGIPAVAVFGYTDPSDIIDLNDCVSAVYDPHLPCQPCRKAVCSQPEIYCLRSIEPEVVAERLTAQWEKLQHANAAPHPLLRISVP